MATHDKINHTVPDNWYETFFEGVNCEMWEKAVTPEWTNAEVEFLKKHLQVVPGDSLLDVPSGFGRHALALAREGYSVTAIDISAAFVKKLKKKIQADDLPIEAVRSDFLTLEFPENSKFDGAYCLGNSFGYVDYEGMRTFTGKIAGALRPGSKFIINSGVVAESILPNFPKSNSYTLGDLKMEIVNDYNPAESYMTSDLRYTRGNRVEEHRFKHYVFTISEIHRLLKEAGLHVLNVFSTTDGKGYKLGDQQMYLVAEKVPEQPTL